MIFLLYRVLQALASPAILVYFLFRGLRKPHYFATLLERTGTLPPSWKQTAPGAIWLHAVSVGEVLAAIPLLQAIRRERPKISIFLSTTTLAGQSTAATRVGTMVDGIFYAPIDAAWCVRRVLRHLKPSMLVMMETEIWPNMFREARRVGMGLVIVNGRISDRALPKYRKYVGVFREVLSLCDRILVQSEEMQQRYVSVGAPAGQVHLSGNLKYDFTPTEEPPGAEMEGFLAARSAPLWIAASTSADDNTCEESAVIAAQRQLPGWRVIIAPRKPERFDAVATMLEASGLRWTRRTNLDDPAADVLLLDSIGELSRLFGFAQVVFMGGSLVNRGGHNILEPASYGKPVIAGPHMENFRDIADHFLKQRAMVQIQIPSELPGAVVKAAADIELGARARAAADSKRGATARTLEMLLQVYDLRYPTERRPQPLFVLGWLLMQLWKYGSDYDRRRKRRAARKLPVPVVGIGNITVGGTGKTPVTIELLDRLTRDGVKAGLLMRGHRRDVSEPVIVRNREEQLPVSHTGDEAQLYRNRLNIPIGIYQDRYTVGKQLIEQTGVAMLLLDDGFQHLQLSRDFDLVLVDALYPFGGGYMLPLGRLREPMDGLARANAFLITRGDEVACTNAIAATIRQHNPHAPIYRARTVPRGWSTFGGRSATLEEVTSGRILAFCGLGNPNSFWRTLRQLEIKPLEELAYDDHQRYTPVLMRRLISHAKDIEADILITTAKDAVNLCEGCEQIVEPLKIYWLDIGVAFDDGGALLTSLKRLLFPGRDREGVGDDPPAHNGG